MTLGQKQEIFTSNVAKLIIFAESKGLKCRARELQRTQAQQEIYIKEGKSKTYKSNHLNSCAIDIYFTKNGKLLESKSEMQFLGDYWESLHSKNKWGGNYKSFLDCPHFEMDSY